jgi:hypothetical protein
LIAIVEGLDADNTDIPRHAIDANVRDAFEAHNLWLGRRRQRDFFNFGG